MCTLIQMMWIIILFVIALWDIRYQRLPIWMLIGLLMAAMGCKIIQRDVSIMEIMAGIAVGGCFLAVSKVTREAFGYADSILIVILGVFLGVWDLFILLSVAFLLAALFSFCGLLIGRFSRRLAFPFIPFLTISYVGMVFWKW
ncbi:MAG: prepilin peptidase [Hespellia sp.]|nr:prepilin peptidase [Hespellia sp.]